MRRDSVLVLASRGVLSALGTWKALLLALVFNLLLAYAFAHPVNAALRQALDKSPWAARLAAANAPLFEFYGEISRARPDVFGDLSAWDAIATGDERERGARRAPLSGFLSTTGVASSATGFAVLAAALSALLAGGFAGRFGSTKENGSLAAFGADAARFAPASLLLGALSLVGIAAAYRWIYVATGSLYEAEDLRYEWEAILLSLLRLGAFLVAAAIVRLVVLYTRAAMGRAGKANLVGAFGTALGFLARRPARALALEILFGALGILPLLLWALLGPVWDGNDAGALALVILGQQAVVLIRILARTAHLGAASAFLARAAEAAAPAPSPKVTAESEPAAEQAPGS
ncbi:MAG TPA: hypothetical protein VGM13_17145 [Thermoanaerobaculia bacterium]